MAFGASPKTRTCSLRILTFCRGNATATVFVPGPPVLRTGIAGQATHCGLIRAGLRARACLRGMSAEAPRRAASTLFETPLFTSRKIEIDLTTKADREKQAKADDKPELLDVAFVCGFVIDFVWDAAAVHAPHVLGLTQEPLLSGNASRGREKRFYGLDKQTQTTHLAVSRAKAADGTPLYDAAATTATRELDRLEALLKATDKMKTTSSDKFCSSTT